MTEHLKRDMNVSQKAMKEMQRELSEARKLIKDMYHLLPSNVNTACNTKIAKEATRIYLEERGLLR